MSEQGLSNGTSHAVSEALLAATHELPLRRGGGSTVSGSLVDRTQAGERQRYLLQERVAELELRLRERSNFDEVHELELRSMQQESELKSAYVAHLETVQGSLHEQLAVLEATRIRVESDLTAQLAEANRRLAELEHFVIATQARRSYRLMNHVAPVARLMLAPALWVRRLLLHLRHRLHRA